MGSLYLVACELLFFRVFGLGFLETVFPPRRDIGTRVGARAAHPEGRNGVEDSEALRRVVRTGSRGTIGSERGTRSEVSAGMERSENEAEALLDQFEGTKQAIQ